MYKNILVLMALVFSFNSFAQVEDFEEFKKRREAELNQFERDVKSDLDSLRVMRDRVFAKMLSGNWSSEQLFETPVSKNSKLKPKTPPVFTDQNSSKDSGRSIVVIPENTNDINSNTSSESVIITEAKTKQETFPIDFGFFRSFTFQDGFFFGNEWKMIELKKVGWPVMTGKPSSSAISTYWTNCSAVDYKGVLDYFQAYSKRFILSDWGLYSMILRIAELNFTDDNNRNLFVWFQLVQLGFDARIMFDDYNVYITLPFNQVFYGKTYFEFGEQRYYLMSRKASGSLMTHKNQHESANRSMTLYSIENQVYPENLNLRSFSFRFNGEMHNVAVPFSKDRVEFYNTIPQTELGFYFNQKLPKPLLNELKNALMPVLNEMSNDRDRVRYLYAMVCQGIQYQTDAEQFNKEKFCFFDEVLFYPFADCEDRTFLLNSLIKELLGLKTVGLNYPGHVAMAVLLENTDSREALIAVSGENFVFCDPTYIGADLGMMPDIYKGQSPKLIW